MHSQPLSSPSRDSGQGVCSSSIPKQEAFAAGNRLLHRCSDTKLDPAKKHQKLDAGSRKKTPSSKRRLGSGFVEALLISCHMVQLSDHQHDLNVCQQWNFHRITWFPGDQSQGPTQLPCTLSVIPCQSFSLSRRFYFVTTQLAKLNFQRVALSFLLWVAKSVCVMACPCGSVPVGVETLHERLSCSRPGKKVAGLSETLTCQIGTHQCTRRPLEEWDVRIKYADKETYRISHLATKMLSA